jgi:hypothetical protein
MNEQERAGKALRSLLEWTEQLHWYISVAASDDLTEFDDRMRESFPYEWNNATGRFVKLEGFASRGLLTPSELAEFHDLALDLTDLVPTMQRLRLWLPDLDALARAAARPSATPTS